MVSDICDGVVQATDGMSYSLISRDIIAAYYSEEAIGTARRFAAEEVVRVLTGQSPLSPVNAGDLAEARWSRSR